MTPDIVQRLRSTANDSAGWVTDRLTVCDDAADEIERLRSALVEYEALIALDALTAGHPDVHLHRNPDGTVSVTPMRESGHRWSNARLPMWVDELWVDVESGVS